MAAVLVLPAPAAGHAALLNSTPAPGQRLLDPPARIALQFSQRLNPRLSGARLLQARSGSPPLPGRWQAGGRALVLVAAGPLPRGSYRVSWRSVSTDDGHPLEGSFSFGVRAAAPGGSSLQGGASGAAGWTAALLRWALYLALLPFAGGLLVQALVARRGGSWMAPASLGEPRGAVARTASEVANRGRALGEDAGALALGLAGALAAVEAFAAAGRLVPEALPDFLLDGVAGRARLALVACVAVALALARRWPRAGALGAAAALASLSASGHAWTAQPRAATLVADFVHLLGGAVWLGAGALLAAAWWPALRRADPPVRRMVAAEVLPAFSALALPAFLAAMVAGTIAAAIELGRPSALWGTTYGVVLSLKVGLVVAAGGLARAHVRRLGSPSQAPGSRPATEAGRGDRRLLSTGPLVGVGIAAAAALLAALPLPPGRPGEGGRPAAGLAACSPCPLPTPRAGELAVASLAGTQVLAAYVRRGPGALAGQLRLLDRQGRPAPGPMRVAGARTRPCGRGCLDFTVRGARAALRVRTYEGRRSFAVALPARWSPGQAGRARRVLERAQATMRGLASVRELERVSSGPGSLAVTRYRLRAPDRLDMATGRGVEAVRIGDRQWLRLPGQPWRRRDELGGGLPFTTRSWFAWTPYAQTVRLIGVRRGGGRRVAELALMDPGTPVWIRLWVDRESGRVLLERLVARGQVVTRRFFGFNSPISILPPPVPRR